MKLKLEFKFALFGALLFALFYGYISFVAKNRFDAAWLVALSTIPVSNLADFCSRLLAGGAEKNIYLDLALLLLFGLIQYAFLGYLVGRVAKYLSRSSGHAQGDHDE